MDEKILNKILNIGFKYIDREDTGFGIIDQYKYYPTYFKDVHYTLIMFKHNSNTNHMNDTYYRLYIHKNLDGSFVSSPFDFSFRSYVHISLENIFKKELLKSKRIDKLNRIFGE